MKCPNCRTDNPPDSKFCRECATPIPEASFTKTLVSAADELARGTVFAGRYEIIEELGAGGMGRVYRVHDTKLNEEVALKLIRPEIAAEKRTVERFRNEIKLARKIRHNSVCGMYDFHEEGKWVFLTMEYVRGEDLKSLIHRMKALTIGASLAIARQIAEGLGEAHRLGIIHRDLKPGNVMIDRDGNAKIMDFGIARAWQEKGITGEGAVIGTPEYMSPEQVDGKPTDARADIYALGAILFEMVAGRPPFEGETPLAIAHKHKYESAPDPRAINPHIPANLGRLILRCLEKASEARYQTTEELLVGLATVEEALPAVERAPSGRPLTKHKPAASKSITVKIPPRKFLIPAVLLVLSVIAAVSFWHPWRGREISAAAPRIDNSIAVISFENLTGDPRHDGLVRAVPNLMITKLEAIGIPYVASWERLRDLLKQMGRDPDVPIDKETGFELCRREGIAVLVTGEITKAGSVFVTNIKALDVGTKGSLASASSQGRSEESILLSQIDELAGRVYQKLDWPLVNIGDSPPVAEFTTASMEAYNHFLRGKDELERYNYANARGFLEKAVGVDPNFASAYRLLSRAHQMLGNVSAQSESLKKAVSLSSRASEKERLYISATAAASVENRIDTYQRIITKYPREKEAYYWLGFHYQNIDLGKAVDFEEKAVGLDPSYRPAVNTLGCFYLDLGAYDKGIEWLKRYLALSPGDANPLDSLGAGYFGAGDLDEAIGKFKEALDIDPYFGIEWKIAYIYALKEDYQEAMRWLDRGAALKTSAAIRSQSLRMRAFFHHWRGESDKALIDLERASEEAASTEIRTLESSSRWLRAWLLYERGDVDAGEKQRKAYEDYVRESPHSPAMVAFDTCFYMGLCALKRSQVDSASDFLSKMKALLPDVPRLAARSSYYQAHCDILEGEIKIAAKAPERAVVICEKTAPWINLVYSFLSVRGLGMGDYLVPFQKDTLARAYRETGAIDEAIAEYERLITFNPKRGEQALIHPKYRYRLAQLYEARGERAKAAAEYRKFLDIWRNADPGLQEVEDAKKCLAALD